MTTSLVTNPSHLGENGLSVASPGSNPYEPYFGPLSLDSGFNKSFDPSQRRPTTIRNLPDAYKGQNERLLSLIEEQVILNSDFLIKTVLPVKEDDALHYYWNIWKFNNTLLQPVPYQGVSRYIQNETAQDRKSTIRYGVAFILEYEFMNTAEGRLNYEYNLRTIARCVNETHNFDILRAIISANKDIEQWSRQMGYYSSKSFHDIMEEERDNFATLQKHKNAFEKLDALTRERISLYGGEATLWLIEPILKYYVSLVPSEKTDYYMAGPQGPSRVQSGGGAMDEGNPNLIFGNGVSAYLVRQFNYDNHQNLCAMQRQRQIGEMNQMFPALGTDPATYRRNERDIVIYNEDKDQWHLVTLEAAIENCCMFDQRPGEHGLCLLDKQAFSKGKSLEDDNDDSFNPFMMDSVDVGSVASMARSARQKVPIQVYGHLSEDHYDSTVFLDVAESIRKILGEEDARAIDEIFFKMEATMNKVWTGRDSLLTWLKSLVSDPTNNTVSQESIVKSPSSDRYVTSRPYRSVGIPLIAGNTYVGETMGELKFGSLTPEQVQEIIIERIGTSNFNYWRVTNLFKTKLAPIISKLQHLLPNCILLDPKLTPSDHEQTSAAASFFEYAFGQAQFRVWIDSIPLKTMLDNMTSNPLTKQKDVSNIGKTFSSTIVFNLQQNWKAVINVMNNILGDPAREFGTVLAQKIGGFVVDKDFDSNKVKMSPDLLSYTAKIKPIIDNNADHVPFLVAGYTGRYVNYEVSIFLAKLFGMMIPPDSNVDTAGIKKAISNLFIKLYGESFEKFTPLTASTKLDDDVVPLTTTTTKKKLISVNPTENFETIMEWVRENSKLFGLSQPDHYISRKRVKFLEDLTTSKKYEDLNINSMLKVFLTLPEDLVSAPFKDGGDVQKAIVNAHNRGLSIGKNTDLPLEDVLPTTTAPISGMQRTTITLSTKQFKVLYELLYKSNNPFSITPYITIGSLENRDSPASFGEMQLIYNILSASPSSSEFKSGVERYPQLTSYIQDSGKRASFLSVLGLYKSSSSASGGDYASKRSRVGDFDDAYISGRPDPSRQQNLFNRKSNLQAARSTTMDNFGFGDQQVPENYLPSLNNRLINHWNAIHQGGNHSMINQILARCLLLTPFSKESLISLYRNHCIVPVSFILARPHMNYNTSLAIKILPGARTGNLMIGHRDFQLGNDPKTKVFYGHFTLHSVPIVRAPENIRVIYDIFCKECLGGAGVRFWNEYNRAKYDPAAAKTDEADMFSFMVAYHEERYSEHNPIDCSGHFSYLDAPGLIKQRKDNNPHYSTAGFYNRLWKFRTVEMQMAHAIPTINFYHPYHEAALFQQSSYNTVCWLGAQGQYNKTSGKHDNLIPCTGHWGETGYGPGARKVRNGGLESFKTISEIVRTIPI
jgi:hypothetical protein